MLPARERVEGSIELETLLVRVVNRDVIKALNL